MLAVYFWETCMSSDELKELRSLLTSASRVVARSSSQEAYDLVLRALVLVARMADEIENGLAPAQDSEKKSARLGTSSIVVDRSALEAEEVRKVAHRLTLWAKRPDQLNSRILRAYLELVRENAGPITERQLRGYLPRDFSFDGNFTQMRLIGPKNHGKVFDVNDGVISIWPPVSKHVKVFEEQIFCQ